MESREDFVNEDNFHLERIKRMVRPTGKSHRKRRRKRRWTIMVIYNDQRYNYFRIERTRSSVILYARYPNSLLRITSVYLKIGEDLGTIKEIKNTVHDLRYI